MNLEEFNALPDEGRKNILLQTIRSLERFPCAEILWTKRDTSDGESAGLWHVRITARTAEVKGEARRLADALIPAEHDADEANVAFWKQRNEARDAALSKLTPEERKVLGL